MHDREVARYIAAEGAVREHASAQLHRYLDDLRFWMRGNLDWSIESSATPPRPREGTRQKGTRKEQLWRP